MEHDEQRLHATKLRIARYLTQHPAAADSVRGIQCWWLHDMPVARELVEQALAQLVADGTVSKTVLPDGTPVYSASGRRT